MSQAATLIIANSEIASDLLYATKFLAPDPFIFCEINGEKIILMSDLELDRAREQAQVDKVLSYSEYEDRAKKEGNQSPGPVEVIDTLLRERGVRSLLVPADFGLRYAEGLQSKGYAIATKPDPFFESRTIKTDEEIKAIRETQKAVETAVSEVIDILRDCLVKKGILHWTHGVLTSEAVKRMIHMKLLEMDCIGQHTIVAGGIQGCDPHNEGSGPLKADESIVMDVFPRSSKTRYFADMSRTIVKGQASKELRRLYDTVLQAQEEAVLSVREGASGRAIHEQVVRTFEKAGYRTGMKDGRMQGFFHGTGHGLGLDIHEPPRISRVDWTLKAGEVVTVEPGLYYPEIGAVRIEDMVLVTSNGSENLTTFPKFLEV